jgi:hypothetical protein
VSKRKQVIVAPPPKPALPVQYDAAVKALQECLQIDDAKLWADKADALAAWAKVYRDDVIGRQARQLKLHAYRKMGELAGELRPGGFGGRRGSLPGPRSLLLEQGLPRHAALAARTLVKLDEKTFNTLLERKCPPSPLRVRKELLGATRWTSPIFSAARDGLVQLRKYAPAVLAAELQGEVAVRARTTAREIINWFTEFEKHLPKEGKK